MARTIPISHVQRGLSLAALCFVAAICAWAVLRPAAVRGVVDRVSAGLSLGDGGSAVIVTALENGAYRRVGDALRTGLENRGAFPLEVQTTAGSVENIRLLQAGEADFGLIQSGLKENRDDIMSIARIDRQFVHLVVPADSPAESLRDLAGKRVGVGPLDSGFEALGRRVFEYFDFFDQPVLVHDHGPDIGRAFREGRIDAMFTVHSLFAPAMEELLASGWYRPIPIHEAEAVARFLPGVYAAEMPHSLYGPDRTLPAADAPFPTLSVDTLLVARADEPARRVETLLEVLYSGTLPVDAHLDGVNEAYGRSAAGGPIPMHPAAEAFYARHDPLSSDSFEIASFFLAGLVCLVSATHYLLGRRADTRLRKRREKIMPYFERMLEFGVATENTDCPETLMDIAHEMMATNRRAERAWLAGKLETEHMENLYQVYNIRSRNAFDKMIKLQMQRAGRGVVDSTMAQPEARGDFAGRRYWEEPNDADVGALDTEDAEPDAPERPDWSTPFAFAQDDEGELSDVAEGIGPVRIRRARAVESAGLDTQVNFDDAEEESDFVADSESDEEEEDKDQLSLF